MGKDFLSVLKESLLMFMCLSLGVYFSFATYFSVRSELIKDKGVPLESFRED